MSLRHARDTVTPADGSEGCTFNMNPRPTGPAPSLTRLATVSQKSRPKTYTAMSDATLLFRVRICVGDPPSTSCSGTSTPSSRYTSGRPNERPTRSAGRFAPRYSCRGAQPRYHGEISKRLLQAYERPADVSLGCDICMNTYTKDTHTETTRSDSYKQKSRPKTDPKIEPPFTPPNHKSTPGTPLLASTSGIGTPSCPWVPM